ncbi:MAG: MFS transporter [Bacteroidota bacterium]
MTSDKKFQSGNIITISAAHLIHDLFSSFFAPLLPLLINKMNLSFSFVGFLTVVHQIPSLFNPLIGVIATKMPVRFLLIFAPSITAISMSLLGLADHYIFLVIILLVAGIGSSLFHVPAPVLIRKIAGRRIGKGMSFFMFGGEIARSLGPILILGAVTLWGLEGTYKLIPLGLFSSFILFFRFKNVPISSSFENKNKEKGLLPAFKKHRGVFISITGIFFFSSMVKSALTTFLPTFITAEGNSIWSGGIALSALQLAGAGGTFLSGTISDKIGRRKTLMITSVLSSILMFAFLNTGGAFIYPVLILLGFFLFASTPVLLAVVNEIKSDHPVFLNGIFMTINFVFSALGVMVIGVLGDLFGLKIAYILSPFLGLLTIPFIYKLRTQKLL